MIPGIPRNEYNTLVNEKNSGSKRYLYDIQDTGNIQILSKE